MRRVAVITNATQYAGPGAIEALSITGTKLVCHDPSFVTDDACANFEATHPGTLVNRGKTAASAITRAVEAYGRLDVLISNDIYPLQHLPLELSEGADMRRACEALLVTPFVLIAKAAAQMRYQSGGHIVLITSAAPLRPEAGFSTYSAARAGASALARSAARELAPYGITVNAIAPSFLASEMFYPAEIWDTPQGHAALKTSNLSGRLGTAQEIGALITFLTSGNADFLTGEVINFTGGWV